MRSAQSTQMSVLLIALGACNSSAFTPATHRTFPARSKGCVMELLSAAPQRVYEEIGTFAITNVNKWGADDRVDTDDRLREVVGERACAAGADALITTVNRDGWYIKAVAIRWNPDVAPADQAAVPISNP